MRKPSTPRSSQKRSMSCIAASTSGLSQLRSGCSAMNECRYHCPVALVEASTRGRPPGTRTSSRSAARRCRRRRARRTSRGAGCRASERDSRNHGWRSELWLGTQSTTTRMPRAWASSSRRSKSSSVPNDRVDVEVVGDVVAEVGHRRAVERRQPDRLGAELREVVEARGDAAQVADAVAVGVGEGARVDLVDRPALPPRRPVGHAQRARRLALGLPLRRLRRCPRPASSSARRTGRTRGSSPC